MAEQKIDELKISEEEANAVRISNSADRPNAFSSYRESKKTAADVKKMFDAPFELLRAKHDKSVDELRKYNAAETEREAAETERANAEQERKTAEKARDEKIDEIYEAYKSGQLKGDKGDKGDPGSVNVVDGPGDSEKDAMSQKATTDAIDELATSQKVCIFGGDLSGNNFGEFECSIPVGSYNLHIDSVETSDTDATISTMLFRSNGSTIRSEQLKRNASIDKVIEFSSPIDAIHIYASDTWNNGQGDTFSVNGLKIIGDTVLNNRIANIEKNMLTQEEAAYYSLKGKFELGTVWLSGTTIMYTDATSAIRMKKGTAIYLNSGDVVSADDTAEFRIVRVDEGFVEANGFITSFTVADSGNYTFALKKKDDSVIDDIEILVKSLAISNSGAKITKRFEEIEKDITTLSGDSWRIHLNKDQFESGTAYQDGGVIAYLSDINCVRVKKGTKLPLYSGSRIVLNGIQVRVIYAETDNISTVTNYTSDPVVIPTDGDYVLVFKYPDNRPVGSVDEILALFYIENGNFQINKRLSKLEQVKVDNSAKSVFSIMCYNVGLWYNGSGSSVPTEDYERFLALHESIIDRYAPDILCVQEHRDEISVGKSAFKNLLESRYHFFPAYQIGAYDGKAICTSRSLSDAENILFVQTEGGLTRNYEKAYVYLNGRKVCVISAHLSMNEATCANNIEQLLADVQDEDYVIICADTNIDANAPNSAIYQSTLKQFTDAGYVLANDGSLKTYPKNQTAIDNIIVSSNITIKSALVDTQKIDELAIDDVDHLPLVAYIELF